MKYHPAGVNVITVKPLYSGHHRYLRIVFVIERSPLHRGYSQIGLFYFKDLPKGMLGFSAMDPKVFQEAGVGRRKILKTIY